MATCVPVISVCVCSGSPSSSRSVDALGFDSQPYTLAILSSEMLG